MRWTHSADLGKGGGGSVNLPEKRLGDVTEPAPEGYAEWFADVKQRVRATSLRAARAVNAEVILLYWSLGKEILDRQERLGWGGKVIPRLAAALGREFPDQKGWSPRNLQYMRAMAEAWRDRPDFVPQVVAQMPWGHVRTLLDRLSTDGDRDWYAMKAVEHGWSRAVLSFQIGSGLLGRIGAAPSNFQRTLVPPDSELAQQLTKDPYVFQHLGLGEELAERGLEDALMDRLQDTLMELGRGMTFVGRRVRFTVDGVDRWVDLLLFHTEQLRYIVIELKVEEFEAEFVGQLGAYVVMVDDRLRKPAIHAPTIGLLLCTGKRVATVRYALAASAAPIAVAPWQGLPDDARAALPSVEELEAVVQDELARQASLHAGAPQTEDPATE